MRQDPETYPNQSRMDEETIFGTDVDILATTQVLGRNIYVFNKFGSAHKWLKFQCTVQGIIM